MFSLKQSIIPKWQRFSNYGSFYGGLLLTIIIAVLVFSVTKVYADSAATQQVVGTNQVTRRLLAGDAASSGRVNITDNQSQDFFSPVGDTVIDTDSDGNWSNITLTPAAGYKKGAVTLNTRIDMTQDFSFNWQVQMKSSTTNPSPTTIADGIGFALHPTYAAGDLGPAQTVPQNINSIGLAGGNLGTADLMNAIGFKLDSYFNWGSDPNGDPNSPYGEIPNTYYQDPKHNDASHADAYATWDNRIDGVVDNAIPQTTATQWGPYGMFTKTSETGYMTNTASDDGTATEETPLTGAAPNSVNLLSGNWMNMAIDYTASTRQLTVKLSDPSDAARTMTWQRTVASSEIKSRYYAFTILSSTGARWAQQGIQHLSGYFTPEGQTVLVRKVTTNGTSIADAETYTQATPKKTTAPVTMTPTDSNNQFQGVLSHILFTYYDSDGNAVTKRVNVTTGKDGFDRDDTSWWYTVDLAKYSSLTIVNYVYRRSNNVPALNFQYAGAASDGTYKLQPNSDVTVTASVANPATGPATWMGVYALDQLPASLQLKAGSTGASQTGNQLKIPLGNIGRNKTGTATFTLHYTGTMPATLYPGGAPASGTGMDLGHNAYVYDQSPYNIDAAGKRVDSSYYYVPATLDAPLATESATQAPVMTDYTNLDPGNFVPHIGSTQPAANAAFHYWDITSAGATTMDPAKTGHPTTDITGSPAKTMTGTLGNTITNAPQPSTLADYTYVGYYEFTGSGTSSTWHDAGSTAPSFYYQTRTSNPATQQIAYIYRPTKDYLSLTVPNIDFGKHPIADPEGEMRFYPMTSTARVAITDQRPHTGIPDTTGSWQLDAEMSEPLTGINTGTAMIDAQLNFKAATPDSATDVTTSAGIVEERTGTSTTLATAQTYGSHTLSWDTNDIILQVPWEGVTYLVPDKYRTTLTWTLSNGLN